MRNRASDKNGLARCANTSELWDKRPPQALKRRGASWSDWAWLAGLIASVIVANTLAILSVRAVVARPEITARDVGDAVISSYGAAAVTMLVLVALIFTWPTGSRR